MHPASAKIIFAATALLPVGVFAQLNANFSASPVQGCAPLVVEFTDLSTGNPIAWDWDFGNGNVSDTSHPFATYLTPGTYTVKLVVYDGTTYDSITKVNYITVFKNPTANFTGSPLDGCTPLTVSFTDLSVNGDGPITAWLWDFGDGFTSTQKNPTHTFSNPGTYSVSLSVTDVNGCKNILIRSNYVEVDPRAYADFSASPTYSCNPNAPITFTNVSTGQPPLSFLWNFGDGSFSTVTNPSHIYGALGVYDVTLIVEDGNGCRDTLFFPGYITLEEFTASISVDKDQGCIDPVQDTFFFNSTSGPFTTSTWWDFGDGTTSSDPDPSHIYNDPGVYVVTFVAGGVGCKDTLYDTIYVQQIQAGFDAVQKFYCDLPANVQFIDLSFNAVTWYWDLDSTYVLGPPVTHPTSTQQNPTYTYEQEGKFDIWLVAWNAIGCVDTVDTLEIVIDEPQLDLIASPSSGCAPLTVNFSGAAVSTDPIVSWYWDSGDGATSNQQTFTHTYVDTGIYFVTMITTTATGCVDTMMEIIQVGNKPTADFTTLDTAVCACQAVIFDISTDFANEFVFDFGDGNFVTTQDTFAAHSYSDTGYFTVTMTYYHNGCPGDSPIVRTDLIYVWGPVADFVPKYNCADPYTVEFIDSSLLAHHWKWYFSDGDSSDLQNPVHTFPSRGSFDVVLIVTNDSTGCSCTRYDNVQITDPEPHFTISDTVGCHQLMNIAHDASASIDAATYHWHFGNGFHWDYHTPPHPAPPIDSLIHPPLQDYDTAGVYFDTLWIRDVHGCEEMLIKKLVVHGHDTRIDVAPVGCAGVPHQFSDSTVADTTVVSWLWTFGDGGTSAAQHPAHIYADSGDYEATLQTTDLFGCTDQTAVTIHINNPEADFSVSNVYACTGQVLQFQNTSPGTSAAWHWQFGDGDTSALQNPQHSYATTGTFDVTLTITDPDGCQDTLTKPQYITVVDPFANFSASPVSAPCPPLLVSFNDSSTGNIIGWEWDFGDGSGSNTQHPQHNYTSPGSYDVTLIVTGISGCRDTLTFPALIVVGGPDAVYHVNPMSGCPPLTVTFWITNKVDVAQTLWDFGDGFIGTGDTVTHTYANYGTYLATLIINNGLSDTFECERALALPPITVDTIGAGFSTSVEVGCVPQSVIFTDGSIGDITSWSWNFGNGNTSTSQNPPQQLYSTAGTYTITLIVTSADGCVDTLSKEFRVYDPPVALAWGDTTICEGGQAQLNSVYVPHWSYKWQPDPIIGPDTSHSTFVSPATTTAFAVIVTDTTGCSDTSNLVTVGVWEKPNINIEPDTTIHLGDTVQIRFYSDQTVVGYAWSPMYNLSCGGCAEPLAWPWVTTTYTVTVHDTNGCFILSDLLTIEVLDDMTIAVPDAFTPNGDGLDDVIYVRGRGIEELLIWQVYDRWGELVFESTDLAVGWDGTYRGRPQNMETYSWYARGLGFNGQVKEAKGSFHLLR